MEGTQVMVFQDGNTVTVGSDGELHRSSSQVTQYSLVVRMHSVLARSQMHGANRKAFDHRLDLFKRETVGASGIAVAEGALEVALVGEPKPERNAGIRLEGLRNDRRRCRFDVAHSSPSDPGVAQLAKQCMKRATPKNSCRSPSLRSRAKIRSYSADREIFAGR